MFKFAVFRLADPSVVDVSGGDGELLLDEFGEFQLIPDDELPTAGSAKRQVQKCLHASVDHLPPSRLVVITMSTLLGVTVVVAVSAFSSDHHSLSTTPNYGLYHPSSALTFNYAVHQFHLPYVCSLSTDRHRPVGIRNHSSFS